MNDYSDLSTRRRGRILLVVEGKHEKNELFWLIFKCFPGLQIEFNDVLIYETNIYRLYDDIVNNYTENWDSVYVDLPYIVSKKKSPENIQWNADFKDIFLVFDFERHDPNYSEEKICRMQEYFSDSTYVGQLYLNYPMVESYQDMPGYPNDLSQFMNHKVSVTIRPGKEYKKLVKDSAITKKVMLPKKIKEKLEERYELIDESTIEECMLKILSLDKKSSFLQDAEDLLKCYLSVEKARSAACQFYHIVSETGYINQNIDYWTYMQNELKKIIQFHICKADRIINNDDSVTDFENSFRNIDYPKILNVQNKVSNDDTTGFIWILNTSIMLVPDFNLNFIKD